MKQDAPGQLVSNSTRKILLWGAVYGIASFAAAGILGGTVGGIIAVTAFIVLVPGAYIAWLVWAGFFVKKTVSPPAKVGVWERKRAVRGHPDLPLVIGILVVVALGVVFVRGIS